MEKQLEINKLELIDEQFSYELASFGKEQHSCQIRSGFLAFGLGVFIGMFFALFNQNLLLFNFSMFFIFVGIAYTNSLSMSLVKTFSLHEYDQVWRDMGRTLFWCKSWAPFSQMQLKLVSIVQKETLINQGRYAELEAVTRVHWAYDQKEAVITGIPRRVELADILAISYMGQKKYSDAIIILENLSKSNSKNYLHRSILFSLAYCYLQSGKPEKAYQLLENNEQIMNKKPTWIMALDHDLVRAQLEMSRQNLDLATEIMRELSVPARNNKFAPEFRASYFRTLSNLRVMQNRSEEAELHLQTAIDILRAAPSLNLLSLSEIYTEYGGFLENSQDSQRAQAMYRQSQELENLHLQNQLARLDDMRVRIHTRNKKYPLSMERLICESA